MFKLIEGQSVTIRKSIEFYGDNDHVEIVDGPVTLEILDICDTPNADNDHYNVDIIISKGPYEGWTTNLDIFPDDIDS